MEYLAIVLFYITCIATEQLYVPLVLPKDTVPTMP